LRLDIGRHLVAQRRHGLQQRLGTGHKKKKEKSKEKIKTKVEEF
jgi:hypothetical protein